MVIKGLRCSEGPRRLELYLIFLLVSSGAGAPAQYKSGLQKLWIDHNQHLAFHHIPVKRTVHQVASAQSSPSLFLDSFRFS